MRSRIVFFVAAVLALLLFAAWTGRRSDDLVLALVYGFSDLSTCSAALSILAILKALADFGDDAFTSGLVDICSSLGIQEHDVCIGALGSQAPIIAHALRGMSLSSNTATLFAAKIFGLCPYPPSRHYDMHLPSPKEGRPRVARSEGRKPFRVVHISDVHIDRQYEVGSEADCGRTMCCRTTTSGPGSPNKAIREPAGPYGNFKCDAPMQLHSSMLSAIQHYAGDAQFMLFTGDIVDHAVWLSNEKDVVEGVNQIYSLWADRLQKPVYGTIGNHDVAPTNSFPRNSTATPMTSEWALRVHADVWRPYIGEAAARLSVEHYSGCYAVTDPQSGLRILNLNTGFGYKSNWWLYDSDEWQPDPNGILAWLAGELQAAEDAGQRVWIMGHISAGKSDTLHEWSAYYNELIGRYHETIAVQAFGHSHRSEFEISYSEYSARSAATAISITYVAPALTPSSGNPAFRVYDVDPDTFSVLDYTEYYANMTDPSFQRQPEWRPYYSARTTYGELLRDPPHPPTAALDGTFWHRVTEGFERNETAFQHFVGRLTRGYIRRTCSKYCKDRWIGHLRAGSSEHNGDTVPLGLHIDAVEGDELPSDAGFEALRGLGPQIQKRHTQQSPLRVNAVPVNDGEEDPAAAGCSLHGHDVGGILHGMAAGKAISRWRRSVLRLRWKRARARRTLINAYRALARR